jgi:hypothetical protein
MEHTFETAFQRLKAIQLELAQQSIIDIDYLLALQKEAKSLYEYLQQRLSTIPQNNEKEETS